MAEKRAGLIALVGEPNAGKSTLMNRIVGSKVSIVTHKAQTTRSRIRGIAVAGESQLVFVDTPGLFVARRRLDKAMVAAARRGIAEADIVLLMVQAHRGLNEANALILEQLQQEPASPRLTALAINKSDMVAPGRLLEVASEFAERMEFDRVFMISALRGSGVEDVVQWLAGNLPPGAWPYPPEQMADVPLRVLAAEITREKLLLRLHQEIPYQLAVETESWTRGRDGAVRIEQTVIVAGKSHKKMIIGPGGSVIKQIGTESRREIEKLLGGTAHLFLRIKVRPKWTGEPIRYERMGLSFADTVGEAGECG
ncbi:MAG: GTPase Era [Rhodobacteraceae bacterium]|nr:GTPase Era [Paracoccaceae bacterium]